MLGLKEFDDDQLAPVKPPRHHHQEKRQQWRHGSHAESLPQATFRLLDTTGWCFIAVFARS
jgi:hypothetical protein